MDTIRPLTPLNQPQLPPHHASKTLKFLLLILAVVLLVALGLLVWRQNHSAADSQDEAQLHPKKAATTVDPTADWKVFISTVVNLTFKYPSTASFSESEPLAARTADGLIFTGHQVYFADKNKTFPAFDATSSDFTAEDSIPHDLITGTLDSKSSFTVSAYISSSPLITDEGNGIYKVTGYGSIECSPGVTSYLLIKPPANSGLKYISVFLGSDPNEFKGAELESNDACSPTAAAIAQHVKDFDTNKDVAIKMLKAISIAKTFKVK